MLYNVVLVSAVQQSESATLICACQVPSAVSHSLGPHGLQPARLLCPWVLQARMLEWVAMPSPRGSSQPRDRTHVSYVSCIGRWVPDHRHHLGSLYIHIYTHTHTYRLFGVSFPLRSPQSTELSSPCCAVGSH